MATCTDTGSPSCPLAWPHLTTWVCRWCGRELVRPGPHAAIGRVMCGMREDFEPRCPPSLPLRIRAAEDRGESTCAEAA